MQYKFKTFNVGVGDCITLLLKNDDKEMYFMVDCCLYKPEVNDYIKNEFHGHIDSLILTHIDNDQINGLIEMLKSKPNLTSIISFIIAISGHLMICRNGTRKWWRM